MDWVVAEGLRNGRNTVFVLFGQGNALFLYWWLMMESEQNLVSGLSESALWRYLRLSLKREQCPFVTW